ncbi:MAG: hypothetical protein JNL82_02260 [Myxococcales bacterium]|nr:hypothetical protein [Myxococcales bacterium]
MPTRPPNTQPGPDVFTGFSEFGQALGNFLVGRTNVRCAVLTDNRGDPVDFAHRPARMSAIDVQIAGAQVEAVAGRVQAWCDDHKLGVCEILVEASHGLLLITVPGRECVLVSLHDHAARADPLGQLAAFSNLRRRIADLIG